MEKKLVVLGVVLGFTHLGFVGCGRNSASEKTEEAVAVDSFQCPMDCEMGKFYHLKGDCPVCEMQMVKVDL